MGIAEESARSGPELPRDQLIRIASGFEVSQATYVLAKLGVPDRLASGPRRAEELASEVGAKPHPLFRVMRLMASVGVLTQDETDHFGLTSLGELLRSDVPGSCRWMVISQNEERYRAAAELLHTVRTGETAFNHVFGVGMFEYNATHPKANAAFNAAMASTPAKGELLVSLFNFDSVRTVADIGGGRGAILASLLRARPNLHGILFDLPQVLAEAETFLRENGVLDRCQLVAGSVLDSIPPGADVYLFSVVLHIFADPDATKVLRNVRRVIPVGGTLLLVELVIPPGEEPSLSKQLDLRMLYATGGIERTEPEWRKLLREAGFRLDAIHSTGTPLSLLVARPP
jgi:predicted O-methyltransferase YrrM